MSTDPRSRQIWQRRLLLLAGLAAATVVLVALWLAVRFLRDAPVTYSADEDHFKHGSTGGERLSGIPYWIWVALPELFPEHLPEPVPGRGYSSFGMVYEPGKDPRFALPAGMSMRRHEGLDLVYLNCAACHTGTVRDTPAGPRRIVLGMPANTFDLGAWGQFLFAVANDPKFNPDRMLLQIDQMRHDPRRQAAPPDLLDRQLVLPIAVYLMRDRLKMLQGRLSFIDTGTWGPGRVDTFNTPKALLNFNMQHADPGELTGNCDFPSIWNQQAREGMHLHWDGNNDDVNERNLSAAFGTGAFPPTIDTPSLLRTARWLLTAAPPAYPYPIDGAAAARGEAVYRATCWRCHGERRPPFRHAPAAAGEQVGEVVPIAEIGTDRHRLDSYTFLLAVNQNTLYAGYETGYPHRFRRFRKTWGYANSPLDGIWLRAPYLHNGSVPTLRDLLAPAAQRPPQFYRGYDVYDPAAVGFVANVAEENGHHYFKLDTSQPGNSNAGHEGPAFGTTLPPADKAALIEYLKTF
jgi:mono/diheme cytochrome c family protein